MRRENHITDLRLWTVIRVWFIPNIHAHSGPRSVCMCIVNRCGVLFFQRRVCVFVCGVFIGDQVTRSDK